MFWHYDGAAYNSVRLKWLLLWWRQCSSLVTTILASSNTPCRSSTCETSHPSSSHFQRVEFFSCSQLCVYIKSDEYFTSCTDMNY
jgi:hypothetical protein